MSSAVRLARTDVAIMVDPLSVLAELTRFGRALTGAIRRETVADSAKECLERLFAPRALVLALTTEHPRTFLLAVASGDPPPNADDPFLVEVQEAGRVVRHENPSRLGTPVTAAGHTMGILAVWGKHPDAFDDASEAVLAAVAAQAAIALQNSQLLAILSTGKQEWEQMVDAIRPAIAIVDARGAIRRANRAFAELVGAPVTALTGGRGCSCCLLPGPNRWGAPSAARPASRARSEPTSAPSPSAPTSSKAGRAGTCC